MNFKMSCRDVEGATMRTKNIINPPQCDMVADALERRNKTWIARTKVANDLIVQIGDFTFHIHKLAVVSKSGYLSRFVLGKRTQQESYTKIELSDLPGGAKSFESVVNFCYGWKVDVTATNIAPLYCAANFLEMGEHFQQGNLISQTEAFLTFVILSSWEETFLVLRSCELVSYYAKELQIVKRCSNTIAWKACLNPKAMPEEDEALSCLTFTVNSNGKLKADQEPIESWWFEDISTLRIDHFMEVIESIKTRGQTKPELVGSCIAYWTVKWFSRIPSQFNSLTSKQLAQKLQRTTVESLIDLLPMEKNSVSCNFLIHLLKLGLLMKIHTEAFSKLERRIGSMLEQCSVQDLLVKNHGGGGKDTTYDVGIVIRVVTAYVLVGLRNPSSVGRLVDGYLTLIARDLNLTIDRFKSLVDALPANARSCDDNLYGAIDMYLKAHPNLSEEERCNVCRALEYHRLSSDARQHVLKNDRLPMEVVIEFMLLEQVKLARSTRNAESDYGRTMTQPIMKLNKGLEKVCMKPQNKEIKMIRKEVENMKMQLNHLQMCKVKIQSQVRRCVLSENLVN